MEFITIIIWLFFCGLVGNMASKRDRNTIGYFLLAFLISPLIAFIILLILGNKQQEQEVNLNLFVPDEPIAEIQEKVKVEPENITVPKIYKKKMLNSEKIETLEKLGELLKKGILTKKEFTEEKKKILSVQNEDKVSPISIPETTQEAYAPFEKDIELTQKIREKLSDSKNGFFSSFDNSLNTMFTELFEEKEKIEIGKYLHWYTQNYDSYLIEEIKQLSSSYIEIKKYLSVLIENKIIEAEFPHAPIL